MSGSTPDAALGDYRRFRERQAGGVVVAPAPATAPPEDPTAAQKASERHAISLLTPRGREIEAERIAAIAAATQHPPQQEPRESLRLAHSQRVEAENVSARLRQALDRAEGHLVEAVAARDAAQRDLDTVEAADTARLIEELANGAGRVEAGGGAERLALAAAEHQLGIANRAVETLGADLAAAEKQLAAAQARVSSAICAVLLVEAERQAVEILAEADALDQRRAGLDALAMTITNRQRQMGAGRQPWPSTIHAALTPELRGQPRLPSRLSRPAGTAAVEHWSRIASTLLANSEAEIV